MKTIRHWVILFLMLFLLPGGAFAQDIIYRTDGTVMSIDIVSVEGGTIMYKVPGDVSGKQYYLGLSVVDSLQYDGMGMVTFQKHDVPVSRIKRNYIGTDAYNLLFGNINLSFERLSPSGSTSFTVELLVNLNPEYFYGVWSYWNFTDNVYLFYDPFYFFTKYGFKYYPLHYSLNRTGALRPYVGASLLLGQYRQRDYDEYNYYYNEIYTKGFSAVISWNVGTKIYLADGFAVRADLVVSVIPFIVFNSLEAGIEIGF